MNLSRFFLSVGVTALVTLSVGCGAKPAPVDLPEKVVGRCSYVNKFSNGPECRDYLGEWTEKDAASDCRSQGSSFEATQACAPVPELGECILGRGAVVTRVNMHGDDASKCGSTKRGCELFGGGVYVASEICGGVANDPSAGSGLPVFQEPRLVCMEPKAGEPAGKSDGGQVCTWEMISGATEEGRSYSDYGSCDRVRTQRPYYRAATAENAEADDPRLADPTYSAELGWVKQQIEATACVCCHSSRAPKGTSNWWLEQPGNFANGFYDRGIAMGAGWIDTVGFGAYAPEHNNGFFRATLQHPDRSIFVTTDPDRMRRFFEGEAAKRGLTKAMFADQTYGAGPLDTQRFFRPTACEGGEGVAKDGTITWSGPKARYLYVLEATAASPTVPPNLDLPEGTKWKLDVPSTGESVASGAVKYGAVPAGFSQRYPASGAPAALVPGTTYYLYVLEDIALPSTRCLFTAP